MKTAYTGWMWVRKHEGDPEKFRAAFEQSVLELSYIGYDTLENWTFLKDYFTADEARNICEKYKTSISCLYANLDEGEEALKYDLSYAADLGAKYFICASPNWPEGMEHDSPQDPDEIRREAKILNRLGAFACEKGISLLHNPHSYTPICRRADIDELMRLTDAEAVKLCVDAGHSVIAGVDANQLVYDYGSRVTYVHIKDIDPTHAARGRGMTWVPLGLGTVDLPGFVKALTDTGFDGIL